MKGASALALLPAHMLKHGSLYLERWPKVLWTSPPRDIDWHLQSPRSSWNVLKMWLRAPLYKRAVTQTHKPARALMLTRDVLTWHKMAWDTPAHRCLLTHAEIEVSFDFCFEAQHYALLTLFTQVRIFSACHKCILILPARPSDLRLKSLIAKGFLLTSLTTK